MRNLSLPVFLLLAFAVALPATSPATSRAEEACNPDLLCALSGSVSFAPEKTLTSRTLQYDRKKYRRKKKVPVSFIVDQGRASVFIDGIYEGTTPTDPISLRPGRHEVQLRDRDTIVSQGVIRVSSKSKEALMKVRHPSARPSARPDTDEGPPAAPTAP